VLMTVVTARLSPAVIVSVAYDRAATPSTARPGRRPDAGSDEATIWRLWTPDAYQTSAPARLMYAVSCWRRRRISHEGERQREGERHAAHRDEPHPAAGQVAACQRSAALIREDPVPQPRDREAGSAQRGGP
jgi:hypothetical protein